MEAEPYVVLLGFLAEGLSVSLFYLWGFAPAYGFVFQSVEAYFP